MSVRYWKSYLYYCYNNIDICSKEHKKQFLTLRNNDIKGPSCNMDFLSDYSNIDNNNTTNRRINILSCRNYDVNFLNNCKVINIPSGYGTSMSQTMSQDDISDIYLNSIFEKSHYHIDNEQNIDDPYCQLKPIFTEICNHLKEYGLTDEKESFANDLKEMLHQIKLRKNGSQKNQKRTGTFVSSSSNYVKKRKTHGNKNV